MKIYDENQFTKSKLDERERGDSLGIEDNNVKIIELAFSDAKALANLVLNYAEKHDEELVNTSIKKIYPKNNIQILTKYGYISWFMITYGTGLDHENEVEIYIDIVKKEKKAIFKPKNSKRVGNRWITDEFKEGKYIHQFAIIDDVDIYKREKIHVKINNRPV